MVSLWFIFSIVGCCCQQQNRHSIALADVVQQGQLIVSLGKNSFVLGVVSLLLLCHGSYIVVLRFFESHEHIVVIFRIDEKYCTSQ